jgi:geranylgeranyl diphosphate synthase type II
MLPEFVSADIERGKLLIEEELRRVMSNERVFFGQLVADCMSYALFPGGKRVRPLLGFQVAQALNTSARPCLTHLAAVEILHAASLILDDLPCMDNAVFRRAKPSAHLQFGEDIAILAAIALITLAIRLAGTESASTIGSSVKEFKTMLLDSFGRGGLIAGQELDLAREDGGSARFSKTAPLFELACSAGLVCTELHATERDLIIGFGRSFGCAFQAIDDLEDGSNGGANSARDELESCSHKLAELEAQNCGFSRLREFMGYLEIKRLVSP